MTVVLGVNCSFTANHHDPSATLIIDGQITSACEEERYTRTKSSIGWFPFRAISSCLESANIKLGDIDYIASPGISAGEELSARISKEFSHYFGVSIPVRLYSHPLCHIAGAFYPSGFDDSLGLSIDGSGDRISLMIADCSSKNGLRVLKQLNSTDSLGNLYSAITERLGFHRTEGEFKVMGMAAVGNPDCYDVDQLVRFDDDLFSIDSRIYSTLGSKSCYESFYDSDFFDTLGFPRRRYNQTISSEHFNLAASLQHSYEKALKHVLSSFANSYTRIVYSGGCALNCLANRHLVNLFEDVYVMPAASDRGLSLGAACLCAVENGDKILKLDSMLLGSSYSNSFIRDQLDMLGVKFSQIDRFSASPKLLSQEKVIGWFQGCSEFGPRALGARSVLAAANVKGVKDMINNKIKYRESYRPFAPALLRSSLPSQFDKSFYNYMSIAADFSNETRLAQDCGEAVHFDGSARIQRVTNQNSPDFNQLLENCNAVGIKALINTSFNLNGEPIVESPRDAIRTFFSSALDALVIGDFLVEK